MRAKLLLALGAVALASALDLRVALRGAPPAPSEAEWAQAVAALRTELRPGDLVVHSPLFGVRELSALGELRARPDVPSVEQRSTRRILVLDRTDHRIFGLGAADEVRRFGELLELRFYAPSGGGRASLFELSESLGPDTMLIERPDRSTPCNQPRAEGGFGCPGEPEWLYAAVRTLRVGGSEADCVWAHPTSGGVVILSLPPQPAPPKDRSLLLLLAGGLADDAVTGTPDGAPVQGGTRGKLVVPNALGWQRAELLVDPELSVRLEVTAPRDGRRHFCIEAKVVEVGR